MRYEIIDVSGDIGIKATGKNLKELFISAAEGLFSLITSTEIIEPKKAVQIELRSDNLESLLVSFLNELIFHFDTYGLLVKEILIESNIDDSFALEEKKELKLVALLKGEEFDPRRHERRLLVKAATYHKLKFYREEDLWVADIIFDI